MENTNRAKNNDPLPAVHAAGLSDVGLVRENNEDRFLIDRQMELFAVADGVGGSSAGERASGAVVEILPELMRRSFSGPEIHDPAEAVRILASCITDLSRHIHGFAENHDELRGMGSTLTACLLHEGYAVFCHAGDSRAYLLRKNRLERLTDDHSIAAQLRRMKEISAKQEKHHPLRSALTRYIGQAEDLQPDVIGVEYQPGDRFLLCSDGLTDMVGERDIGRILFQPDAPSECCRDLHAAALEAGGHDNLTSIVIDVGIRVASNGNKAEAKIIVQRKRRFSKQLS